MLDAICERYPVTLHGVNLSLGGTAPLDMGYLKRLKRLMKRTNAAWLSEHACFSRNANHQSHNLLPLPYTEEAVTHLATRIIQVQDFLGEQILLENVSAYLQYNGSEMSEGNFLAEVANQSDCLLLLDINNAFVSAENLDGNTKQFILELPRHRIKEIHLAGFTDKGDYLLDSHSQPVSETVWQLYEWVMERIPDTCTLIEWDSDIPELEILTAEAIKAERILSTTSKYTQLWRGSPQEPSQESSNVSR